MNDDLTRIDDQAISFEPPAATFSGRTQSRTAAVRAGMVAGTALVLVIGAAVAMGASPSPAPTAGGQTPSAAGHAVSGAPDAGGGPRIGDFGKALGRGLRGGMDLGQISVTAISGSSISLATPDGWTRTITVASTTTITKGGAPATLSDLAVGDRIRVGQTRNADGTFAITRIQIVLPKVAGTVTAVGPDSITISARDGSSKTIKTTGSTTYHVGRADGTRADVTIGSFVAAAGETGTDGSLTADSVTVRLADVVGTVTTVTSDTITVTRRDRTTVTIHVAAGTTFRIVGTKSATIADVKSGMVIVAEGRQRPDGSIDASAVGAGDRLKGFGRAFKQGVTPDASHAP